MTTDRDPFTDPPAFRRQKWAAYNQHRAQFTDAEWEAQNVAYLDSIGTRVPGTNRWAVKLGDKWS